MQEHNTNYSNFVFFNFGIFEWIVFLCMKIVVNKPCSVPVHPCGAYKANSLIPLLALERPGAVEEDLKLTHRLDRLTSGLVVLAKQRSGAHHIIEAFNSCGVKKVYLARCLANGDKTNVFDIFNNEEYQLPDGVTRIQPENSEEENAKSKFSLQVDGWIRTVDHRSGINEFTTAKPDDIRAKTSTTIISLVKSKDNECVVRCEPKTGRTHQIRLHLQHLNIPIRNDKCYGGKLEASEHCPLVRHLENVNKTNELVEFIVRSEEERKEKCKEEESLHPSGIFLHAYEYGAECAGLPNVTGLMPDWANL